MLILTVSILWFIVLSIITLVLLPIGYLIGVFSKNARDYYCLWFVKWSLRSILFTTRTKVVYKGLEYLPEKGDDAVCYISNHTGFFDILACYPVFRDRTGFVAKKEMEHWPIISWWMPLVYCLFLDRKDKKQGVKTILDGIRNIQAGVSMLIYPEGTRSKKEGVLLKFHHGSFKLATKNRTTIIPVAMNNSGAAFENVMPHMKKSVISVEFLKPIEIKDMSAQELEALPENIRDMIYERIIANGKEIGSVPADFERPEETDYEFGY